MRSALKVLEFPVERTSMQQNQLLRDAVPTPFGWVLTSNDLDMTSIVEFRNQLLALSRACGTGVQSSMRSAEPVTASEELKLVR